MKIFNLTEWTLEHQPLAYFIIILVFIMGVYSYQNLGRMEDPDFVLRQMVVSVAWPGASAQQVEEQVTDKIEKKLQNTPGLDYLQSESLPGQSYIIVNLKYTVNKDNLQPTWFEVRNMVNDIKDTLPAGVVGPYFNDSFADVYGSVFAVSSNEFTYEEMRQTAEQARQTFLRVPQVKKVELIGVQSEKIYVEMESSKLSQLGLSPSTIIATLQTQNAMTPSGMVATSSDNVYLRVSGMFENLEDLRNLPIQASSGTFRLGDIAKVERSYSDPPDSKMYFNGQPSIGISVSMEAGGNVLTLGNDLNQATAGIKQDLPLGMEINQIANQPQVVKNSINEFAITLLIAIAVILLVCFLSLGIRTGLVVAIGIPLVICGVFAGMMLMDIDLHRVSLGALIIALGLLVDDAIIVVEMMTVKLEQGWERSTAAAHAYKSTASPRLIGALVTCCGFIPVAFSIGAAAEFIGSLFWVVTMALLISWLAAGTATPLLGYSLINAKPHKQDPAFDLYDTKFYRLFKKILNWCLTHRKLVLSLTLAVFLVSLGLMTFVKQEFFPASVRPELIVDLKLPEGSSIQSTEAQAKQLAERLKNDPDIVNYAYYVGQSAPRFVLNAEPVLPCSNFAQFVILAKDYEARVRLQARCEQLIAQEFPTVYGHCQVLGIGPQAKYPVVFRISGPDIVKVKNIANQVQSVMVSQSYLRDVNLDWSQKNKVAHLEIDQDKARMLGIDNQSLASLLQAQLSGIPIAEFREKDRTISMTVRLDDYGKDLSALKDLNVPLSNGKYVPLDQVARISYEAEEGLIWRRALQPTITAQAGINGDMTSTQATQRIQENIKDLRAGLPTGYSIEVGGSEELSKDALGWLMQPIPVMIIIIILLLMIQLESIPKMLMTLSTAPLGLIGVSLALLITHRSLGFVAICGVLALAGIIIRNSVVLIDQIEQQLQAGESVWDSIIHATVQRFRPIMLTAGAAILGMVPLSTSVFWGPMAIALAGGLSIATILTLIVLPTMYAAWYKAAPPVQNQDTVCILDI